MDFNLDYEEETGKTIDLSIKTLGRRNENLTISVEENVEELVKMIGDMNGITYKMIILIYEGNRVNNEKKIKDCQFVIKNGDEYIQNTKFPLSMVLSLRGR